MRRCAVLSAATLSTLLLTSLVPAAATEPTAPPATEKGQVRTPPEVTGRIIVKFKDQPSSSEKERIVERAADSAGVPEAGQAEEANTMASGSTVVELGGTVTTEDAEKLAEEIADDPAVDYAEPDRMVSVAQIAGLDEAERKAMEQMISTAAAAYDADAPYLWALGNLGAPAAWNTATGAGVAIGVVDTGFANHPDLDGNVLGGYDFVSRDATYDITNDGNGRDGDARDPGTYSAAGQCYPGAPASNSIWHGTHVAGSAAAAADSYGTVGIAPDATLLNARALGACGLGYVSDMVDAVYWLAGGAVPGVPDAKKRADVINMSLSMPGACPASMQAAIDFASDQGIPVAVAAGNSGRPAIEYAPGHCYNVITVGAIVSDRTKAGYSNYGAAVDVYAPGHHILSSGNTGRAAPAAPNTRYDYGTSMATPHVAGTLALMRQKNPSLGAAELKDMLLASGDPFSHGKTLNTHDGLYITHAFNDVPWGSDFYHEIGWMRTAGVSNGWTSGTSRTYQPHLPVSRDAMAAFLYRMAGSPAYTAPKVSPFRDVPTSHVFYKEMAWMHSTGISTGWSDGTYRPGESVDRDVMAAFLYRMAGEPAHRPAADSPFGDVATGQAFYREMSWMSSAGISTGWSDGTYRPHVTVDRDVMAAFLSRLDRQI